MRIRPSDSKYITVLLGSFDPRIFQPKWFSENEIIGTDEGEQAEIEVVHQDILKFKLSWLTLLVQRNRFIAEVEQPPSARLYDFILKTFSEQLPHTPIWAAGINRRIEFDAGSFEKRENIGHTLAPPSAWGEWGELLQNEENNKESGLMSISMRQASKTDRPTGYIQTRVQPSQENPESGVFVEVNDHYEIKEKESTLGCKKIMDLFNENYHTSLKRSEWIVDQVMRLAE